MQPETVRTLEANLRIIDQAIAESREALQKDPNSRELIQMLGATYDAKVKMLRQAVEL
jgi:CHASE3 domain sensor protein